MDCITYTEPISTFQICGHCDWLRGEHQTKSGQQSAFLRSSARDFGTKMISHTCYTWKRKHEALELLKAVLVSSGCLNKIPQPGWLVNYRNVFLTVLEAGKSKIKVPAVSVSGESLFPGSQITVFLLCPSGRRGEGALWGLFNKDTNPIHESSTLMT